ncbi:MAG: hypothetical protein GF364_06555 [Candidatus Lokiarchaeota archaeon]|nr:hypothetical protein [Candidatus Lokiarchaeota archaeon]
MSLQPEVFVKETRRFVFISIFIYFIMISIISLLLLTSPNLTDPSIVLIIKTSHLKIVFPILLIINLIVIYDCLCIVSLKRFNKKINPKGTYPTTDYFKVGFMVFLTSHHDGEFKIHEMKIKSKRVCTGCYGTAIGTFFGMILSAMFIFWYNSPDWHPRLKQFLILFSFICISANYYKYMIEIVGWKRLLLNSLFPLGIWAIITVCVNILFSYIILFVLIPYLCVSRVILSKLSHKSGLSEF